MLLLRRSRCKHQIQHVAHPRTVNFSCSPTLKRVFGTQILLRNSKIAENMSLMIDNEIPRKNQKQARIRAANSMNTLQKISSTAARVERELSPADYDEIANLYRLLRVELNSLYELLSPKEKDKYYGYFMKVTEYEKKIAEGVYNPDLDGVLQFDYN